MTLPCTIRIRLFVSAPSLLSLFSSKDMLSMRRLISSMAFSIGLKSRVVLFTTSWRGVMQGKGSPTSRIVVRLHCLSMVRACVPPSSVKGTEYWKTFAWFGPATSARIAAVGFRGFTEVSMTTASGVVSGGTLVVSSTTKTLVPTSTSSLTCAESSF